MRYIVEEDKISFRKMLSQVELDTLELFTTSFSMFLKNFKTFILLSFLCGLPIVILSVYFPAPKIDPLSIKTTAEFISVLKNSVSLGFCFNVFVSIILDVILTIAIALIVQAMIYGRKREASWALVGGINLFFPVFITRILYLILTGLGLSLFVIPGLVVGIRWIFATNVSALRHTSALNAFKYSSSLVKKKWLKSFIILSFMILFQNAILLLFSSGSIDTREGLLSYFMTIAIFYPFNTYFKIIIAVFFLNIDYISSEQKINEIA